MPGCFRVPFPDFFRIPEGMSDETFVNNSLREIENALLEQDTSSIAAFFFEPISWGISHAAPVHFWQGLNAMCRKYEILMVADEVVTGFCRTGPWFHVQECGAEPDIICSAKGITTGYFPFGAVILKAELDENFTEIPLVSGLTNGGNPVGCAACIATIEEMRALKMDERARASGLEMLTKLRGLQQNEPWIGEVRGEGLMLFVELVKGDGSKTPMEMSLQNTIMESLQYKFHMKLRGAMGPQHNCFLLIPPLIITSEQIDDLVGRLAGAFAAVRAALADVDEEEKKYNMVPGMAIMS